MLALETQLLAQQAQAVAEQPLGAQEMLTLEVAEALAFKVLEMVATAVQVLRL